MNMKDHILTALREQFNRWEKLLASMSDEQITAPHLPSNWSIKDVIAHLRAWQQRSIFSRHYPCRVRAPNPRCASVYRLPIKTGTDAAFCVSRAVIR